jgi:GAF domain-containing protein
LEPRQWQPLEIELLNHLASQAAIAIQQSELYQQVRQINTTLECQVQERTAQLQQSLEFEATLKRITDKVRDTLNESQLLHVAMQELGLCRKNREVVR